jgi:hypothetical protein
MILTMPILIFLFVFPIVALLFIFWIWTLVEVVTKEPSEGNDKIVWLILVLFCHFIGSILYCLIRRPERIKLYGK